MMRMSTRQFNEFSDIMKSLFTKQAEDISKFVLRGEIIDLKLPDGRTHQCVMPVMYVEYAQY